MKKLNDIIKYAGHVTAITESLRGRRGAAKYVTKALASSITFIKEGQSAYANDTENASKHLNLVLNEFHKLEYCLDSLYSLSFVDEKEYKRICEEGAKLRSSLTSSIRETNS